MCCSSVLLWCCCAVCCGLSVFVLEKNDTNSCKLFEIRTKFVRSSYELRTKFVTTTFTVRIHGTLGTNFVRTSYEFRTIFAGHCTKSHTNTTYACNKVPTPTHISLYLPPRHTHTHKHTHTHTHTHTHAQNTQIHSMKANSPPLDPHPHTARPHTLIRTWTVDVSRLNV